MAPTVAPVSQVIPVPSIPTPPEVSQVSVFPTVRETNIFKSREDHDLTMVNCILIVFSNVEVY